MYFSLWSWAVLMHRKLNAENILHISSLSFIMISMSLIPGLQSTTVLHRFPNTRWQGFLIFFICKKSSFASIMKTHFALQFNLPDMGRIYFPEQFYLGSETKYWWNLCSFLFILGTWTLIILLLFKKTHFPVHLISNTCLFREDVKSLLQHVVILYMQFRLMSQNRVSTIESGAFVAPSLQSL